jgi:general secretion pathway protein A
MGQSELQEMLGRRELRQLAQRVTARYHLAPLSRSETDDYVRHRLRVAGGEGKLTLTPRALVAVHRLSGGVPRLINLVCDRALLAGYVAGTRVIDAPLVRRAAQEVLTPAPKRALDARALLAAAAALLLVGAFAATTLSRSHAPAAPAPAPPPPTTTVAPHPSALEPLLLGLPRDASFQAALAAVQGLWGTGPLERTTFRTHFDQVRRLDLPVILEMFHPARRDTCSLALLRIEGNEALVATGGPALRVPLAELDRLWTRQAIFLWRDFDALGRVPDPARASAWARDTLGRLGYADAGPDLAALVARFQRDAELTPDGVIGSRTLMTLYSLGPYSRPRLKRGGVS